MGNKLTFAGLFILIVTMSSCKLKEEYDKIGRLNSHFQSEFNYEHLSINRNWSTEENGNYIRATFYQYDLDTQTNSELDSLSNQVIDKLLEYDKEFKNLDYIQVRFTQEDDGSEIDSYVTFKRNIKN